MKFVLYTNDTCGVCKSLKPKIKALSEEKNIPLEVVNVEEERERASQKLIFTIPVLAFEHENKEYQRWVRVFSVNDVKNYLDRIL
ncbi:hypothetical protein OSSY52_09000 [Tepiditoga spiralis]|uniref:Thioredoxin n=1 Tax=Tepiditoga spiralis TaxID=2108365 RepID=A0A7G1GAZ6_9BACT|nr:glutaredoxin family protein [Tepiditoga spiralis]BBE30759.1 hypothetical protein OSSY52_09000 [Tepiditoga spiralis]